MGLFCEHSELFQLDHVNPCLHRELFLPSVHFCSPHLMVKTKVFLSTSPQVTLLTWSSVHPYRKSSNYSKSISLPSLWGSPKIAMISNPFHTSHSKACLNPLVSLAISAVPYLPALIDNRDPPKSITARLSCCRSRLADNLSIWLQSVHNCIHLFPKFR